MKELQTRLDATERRLQEANEILQAQIAERKRVEQTFEKVQKYIESIVETVREPLIMFTPDLRVITGNRSFYEMFHVTPKETEERFVYSIGDHAWDIPVFFLCNPKMIMSCLAKIEMSCFESAKMSFSQREASWQERASLWRLRRNLGGYT